MDVVAIEHHNKLHDRIFVVNWCLGNTCNYSCSYCLKGLHDGSIPWPDIDKIKRFCDRVINHYDRHLGQRVFFEFTGGEVTLFKGLRSVLAHLKSQGAETGIISNGSRRLEYWENLKPVLDQVCLSFHSESAEPEHFKKVVLLLKDSLTVHVNVMMHPAHFDRCAELANWFAKNVTDITLAVQPLLVDFKDKLYDYTPEQLEYIQKGREIPKTTRPRRNYRGALYEVYQDGSKKLTRPSDIVAGRQNNWFGWECWIGLSQLVVNTNGDVYRGWCYVGGKLGNVQEPDLVELPRRPIICDKTFCHCNLDIMNKRRKRHKVKIPFLNRRPSPQRET